MGIQDISIASLAGFMVCIIPIWFISRHLGLGINKMMATGVLRMCLQLGLVGLYLEFLFKFNSPFLNIAYLGLMVCIACHSILNAARLKLRLFFFPLFLSLTTPFSLVLIMFNAVVIDISSLFDARYLIPIGGMLLGNCLRSIILGLSSFYSGLQKDEKQYLQALSLYNSQIKAIEPWARNSIKTAITPILASMATIGLVSLPGMMTGQILGGSLPGTAIKYQIAIMISIFYTEFFTVILSLIFSLGAGFNNFQVLNPEIFKSE